MKYDADRPDFSGHATMMAGLITYFLADDKIRYIALDNIDDDLKAHGVVADGMPDTGMISVYDLLQLPMKMLCELFGKDAASEYMAEALATYAQQRD